MGGSTPGGGAARALAIGAHPDDIEFMMAGTLILLGAAGYDLHYMNLATGSCGTATESVEDIVARRTGEARAACALIGAEFHPPLVNDLEIYHTTEIVARVVGVIRAVRPAIMLLPSPGDYMEDHVNASRVAVTAAFARGMRNYPCEPHLDPTSDEIALYHALPYGLRGPLRERIRPGMYVDVTSVTAKKREMLALHKSQKEWLDESQGIDSYLTTMEGFSRDVGRMSGRFEHCEGWRRRPHLGFSAEGFDPLSDALGESCIVDEEYEARLG